MTRTQQILANKINETNLPSGRLIEVEVDLVLGNDITAPVAIAEFRKLGRDRVFDKNKIALVPDHFTPNKDIKSAELSKIMRDFAKEQEITHYFEIGQMGIEHCLLPEAGLITPGALIIGADSHTCTYGAMGAFSTGVGSTDMAYAMATGKVWLKVPAGIKFCLSGKPSEKISGKDIILYIIGEIGVDGARYKSMEFDGESVGFLSMDDRFTIANMAIEAGAKNGIFPVDEKTVEYMRNITCRAGACPRRAHHEPSDADYDEIITIDVGALEPQVSFPHSPANARPVSEAKNIPIDQVVIGSCTNGRLSDLRIAANILKNKKVAKGVRVLIIPGTQKVYLDALREGLIEIFIESGAIVSTPTCGPCLGGHMGVLAAGEKCVSTTNRNFVGRMGHVDSEVYLASPYVAASTALAGEIAC